MSQSAMAQALDLRLAELLSARLCHELITPIGAVGNGAELLIEETGSLDREALALVAASAQRAAADLRFYRFAYGFSRGSSTTGPPPDALAAQFFASHRIACDYRQSVRALPLAQQKLACNLLLVGAEAMPQGGVLRVDATEAALQLDATGTTLALASEHRAALALEAPIAQVTARTAQAYFTGHLAAALGLRLTVAAAAGRLRIAAVAPAPVG